MLFERMQRAASHELIAVIIAPAYLKAHAGRGYAQMAVASVENLPFAGRFDVVVASGVLERVLGLPDALVSIYRAPAPGGCVVLDLPYIERTCFSRRGCSAVRMTLSTSVRSTVGGFLICCGMPASRWNGSRSTDSCRGASDV